MLFFNEITFAFSGIRSKVVNKLAKFYSYEYLMLNTLFSAGF